MSKNCPKCGNVMDESATFCNRCGSMVGNSSVNSPNSSFGYGNCSTVHSNRQTGKIMIEAGEQIQAELKNSVVKNIFLGDGLASNATFFTDKRFYYKDRRINLLRGGGYHMTDFVIDLKDITATNVIHTKPIVFLILAVISIITMLVFLIQGGDSWAMILAAIIFCMCYFVFRGTYILVYYAGGYKKMSVKMYDYDQILDFHKKLRLIKSKL